MIPTDTIREQYAQLMADIDPRPSQFSPDYPLWAQRADMWAEYTKNYA